MDELPADPAAAALAGPVAGDAVAGLGELPELLDVDVDQIARAFALVATHRFGRLQGLERGEPEASEHPADRGGRDAGLPGDLLAGQALAAQRLDPSGGRRRRGAGPAVRPGGAGP